MYTLQLVMDIVEYYERLKNTSSVFIYSDKKGKYT